MSIAFRITLIIVSVFTLLYMCKKGKITDRVFYFLDIVCDNARFV